ncbi:MAG TPA: HWE histidine kinase domain-containing protein [Xanthobacteraceae bacterium]|nr:HWE histidine kinase domain-containing protein [Xanthobacteraceae bacterium]
MDDKINILLVDDQPAKLLTYEAILRDLDANLISANGAREALEHLLKKEVAVVLIDVYMPETDGFELAAMIREHPRFRDTALIFVSAVLLTDVDRLRGYEMGAVDYVPVPVIPEVLRAKVKVFVDLYRKTKQLAQLNRDLEARVTERTVALASTASQLRQTEQLRSLALAAGQMGAWDWNAQQKKLTWDQGQYSIFGLDPYGFTPTHDNIAPLIHRDDVERLLTALRGLANDPQTERIEFRVHRPDGELRWCIGVAAASRNAEGDIVRISGVTIDITERKHAEERQALLAEEVDHRARNVVAVIQSIMRLTRAGTIETYLGAVDGRIRALSNAHKLLSRSRWEGADLGKLVDEEFAPYRSEDAKRAASEGPPILLQPSTAQTLALALHELATNAAKYGALSVGAGRVALRWQIEPAGIVLDWRETKGPAVTKPTKQGYGTRVVTAGIEHQLGGKVIFDWQPGGLRCTMTVPHNLKAERARQPERPASPANNATTLQLKPGDEVLLVEDEPLVAMMLTDMLTELGLRVNGPHGTLASALDAAKIAQSKAAILDVNLAGDKIYPVADILNGQKVPFIFVTGYARDSIDQRFSETVVLQKPIERQKLRTVLGCNLAGAAAVSHG